MSDLLFPIYNPIIEPVFNATMLAENNNIFSETVAYNEIQSTKVIKGSELEVLPKKNLKTFIFIFFYIRDNGLSFLHLAPVHYF